MDATREGVGLSAGVFPVSHFPSWEQGASLLKWELYSREMIEVSPNSSLAFDILLEECISAGLEDEFLIGLGIVLMTTSRHVHRCVLYTPS